MRERDVLLDLVGRQPAGLGEDHDRRRVELGEHVHRHPRHLVRRERHAPPPPAISTSAAFLSENAMSRLSIAIAASYLSGSGVPRAVGVEVAAARRLAAAGELQLVHAVEHHLVARLHAALDDDPLAVADAEVGLDADHLVGVGRVAAEEDVRQLVLHDGRRRDRQFFGRRTLRRRSPAAPTRRAWPTRASFSGVVISSTVRWSGSAARPIFSLPGSTSTGSIPLPCGGTTTTSSPSFSRPRSLCKPVARKRIAVGFHDSGDQTRWLPPTPRPSRAADSTTPACRRESARLC